MKITDTTSRHSLVSLVLALLVCLAVAGTAAAEPQKVALIPFKVNADRDLSYLRDGIYDMLTSRLSRPGEVVVMQREEVEKAIGAAAGPDAALDEAGARAIGRSLAADFVMIGSLTVMGNQVSMDTRMIDVAGGRPTMAFFEQSEDLGGVITKVNIMASEINTELFGEVAAEAPPPQVGQSKAQAPQQQPSGQAHPEKLLREGRGALDEEGGSPFIMSEDTLVGAAQFWKSPGFKHPVHGLALGDVNGDGKLETVVISDHAVLIYGLVSGKFFKIAEINEDDSKNLAAVDVADINANGTAEIFVSALNAMRQGLDSYVLEFDGKNFVKIVERAAWYFRVVEPSVRGKVLLGQGHNRDDAFSGGIHELRWQGGEYRPEDKVRAPNRLNVLGVAMGQLLEDNQEYLVAFRSNDQLELIDGAGKVVWSGNERLGGSSLYYTLPMQDRGDLGARRYYPMRIIVHNPPGGGKPEVLVAHNFEAADMKLEQLRILTDGQMEALSWDGLGLSNKWKTRRSTGFVRDFGVGDFDGDGVDELVMVVVANEGTAVWSTPKSHIVAYDMVMPQKAK